MNMKRLWEIRYIDDDVMYVLADDLDSAIIAFEKTFDGGPKEFHHDRSDIVEIKKIGWAHYE